MHKRNRREYRPRDLLEIDSVQVLVVNDADKLIRDGTLFAETVVPAGRNMHTESAKFLRNSR